MAQQLQATIERVPSGVRRVIIALVALAILAFLFPLSDDDVLNHQNSLLMTELPITRPAAETLQTSGSSGQGTQSSTRQPAGAGNTPGTGAGRTPVPTPTPSCQPRATWRVMYMVQPGDTLDGIARLVGVPVSSLIEGNCLTNPNRIDIGQEIRVPSLPSPFVVPTPRP